MTPIVLEMPCCTSLDSDCRCSSVIRGVIADDEASAREKLVKWLSEQLCMTVVGSAEDGLSASQCIEQFNPDVAFLDVQMPTLSGRLSCATTRYVLGPGVCRPGVDAGRRGLGRSLGDLPPASGPMGFSRAFRRH